MPPRPQADRRGRLRRRKARGDEAGRPARLTHRNMHRMLNYRKRKTAQKLLPAGRTLVSRRLLAACDRSRLHGCEIISTNGVISSGGYKAIKARRPLHITAACPRCLRPFTFPLNSLDLILPCWPQAVSEMQAIERLKLPRHSWGPASSTHSCLGRCWHRAHTWRRGKRHTGNARGPQLSQLLRRAGGRTTLYPPICQSAFCGWVAMPCHQAVSSALGQQARLTGTRQVGAAKVCAAPHGHMERAWAAAGALHPATCWGGVGLTCAATRSHYEPGSERRSAWSGFHSRASSSWQWELTSERAHVTPP